MALPRHGWVAVVAIALLALPVLVAPASSSRLFSSSSGPASGVARSGTSRAIPLSPATGPLPVHPAASIEFSSNEANWTEHDWLAVNSPLLAFDAADGYLISYGESTPTTGTSNATWELRGPVWYPLSTPGAPPLLWGATMTYDAADGYLLLFGCTAPGTYPGQTPAPTMETWSFRGGNWSQLQPAVSPSLRFGATMTYDPSSDSVVLFGGFPLSANSTSSELQDTWTFRNASWSQLSPASSPPGRWDPGMTYDAADHAVLLFGGTYDGPSGGGTVTNTPRTDSWEFAAGSWRNVTSASMPLASAANYVPPLAFDPRLNESLLMDGRSTWAFAEGRWSWISSSSEGDTGASLAFDPLVGSTLAFGGCHPELYAECDDTPLFGWNGSSWVSVGGALLLVGDSTVFDPSDGSLIAYVPAFPNETNETFRFDGRGWTPVPTPDAPPSRISELTAFDAADAELVLFGGEGSSTHPVFNDTWSFVSDQWTQLDPGRSPPFATSELLAYDPGIRALVLTGVPLPSPSVASASGGPSSSVGTWTFRAGVWAPLATVHPPPNVSRASLAYDPADGWLVLFGGWKGIQSLSSETWAFNGTDWFRLSPSISPSPREGAALGFDASTGYLVLYGGVDPGGNLLGDAWAFVAGEWSPLTFPLEWGPAPTLSAELLFDPLSEQFLMVGGWHSPEGGYGGPTSVAPETYSIWTFQPPPLSTHLYSILFRASGLPAGTNWSVTIGTVTHSSNGSIVSFGLANGSYAFTVAAPGGFDASPSTGSIAVRGLPANLTIALGPTPSYTPYVLLALAAASGVLVAVAVWVQGRRRGDDTR